jgi:hypothetical protein
MIKHPTLFTSHEISRFEEEIFCNPNANEHDASRFFERFPKFLFLGKGKELRREVPITSADGTIRHRIDFFRQSYGNSYWDIIELKTPQSLFITGENTNHPRLSSYVKSAMDQAEDYRNLIIEDTSVRTQLLKKNILVYYPQILVVVGKNNNQGISLEKMQVIYDRANRGPINALSYTDILNFAKEHYKATKIRMFFTKQKNRHPEIPISILTPEVPTSTLTLMRISEFVEQLFPEGSRFPMSKAPLRAKVDNFDSKTKILHVDIGACRYVEADLVYYVLRSKLMEAFPEISHVSIRIQEI